MKKSPLVVEIEKSVMIISWEYADSILLKAHLIVGELIWYCKRENLNGLGLAPHLGLYQNPLRSRGWLCWDD